MPIDPNRSCPGCGGPVVYGSKQCRACFNAVEMLGLVREGWMQADVARAYGVNSSNLARMVYGESWTHLHRTSERIDGLTP